MAENVKKPFTYEICYTDDNGHRVTGQYGDAAWVGQHLKNLEDWGATNITVKIYEEPKNESLTEAPDDDDIMTDDELDAQDQKERDEFEARLKARRDKVAQQRADRDARVARDSELKAKAEEKAKAIGDDWSFDHLFDKLVPQSGPCDSLAGELIRAVNRLDSRWYNDGDRFFEDYGIETCGQPAYFLAKFEHEDENPFWDMIIVCGEDNKDDDDYTDWVNHLRDFMADYIESHRELLAKEGSDMYEEDLDDVKDWLDENNLIPRYETSAEIPQELQAHLDAGNIDERDIIWEVQSWIESMGNSTDDVNIGYDSVYVNDLSKADYDELDAHFYDWLEEYASRLDDEYGIPGEEEEEEPEEESNEEE